MYYFRAKVPQDLLKHYSPKLEIKFSLDTKDRAEAVRRVRLEAVKLDQEFDAIRNGASLAPANAVSQRQAAGFAAEWATQMLREDESDRVAGMKDGFFAEQGDEYAVMLHHLKDALARGNIGLAAGSVEETLARHGLSVPHDSPEFRAIAYEFLKEAVRLYQRLNARQRGEVVEEVPSNGQVHVQNAPVHHSASPLVSQVLARWAAERKPPPKTLADWQVIFNRFEAMHGDLRASQVTRGHVVKLKDSLVAAGKATNTIDKHVSALRTVFEWAVGNDLMQTNPARGVKIAVAKIEREKRLPYNADDLKLIFSSPVYTTGERPKAGGGEAAYWLPLLALFTGARVEELAQALPGDVKDEEGVAVLDLSDRAGDKKVKNKGSRRRIPLHPELIRLGFLDYAAKVREAKKLRLFPDLAPDKWGHCAGNFSKWWGHWARETLGINDKRKVFHSFRHGFKEACRACEIPEEVHDALTGHSGGGEGRNYKGEKYPLVPLNAAIGRLRFNGMDAVQQLRRKAK